jgi:hypothetical protein
MQNEFEKKIQQQMEGFSLTPADGVWDKVAARITREKKRRRLVIFWWTASILIIGIGAGVWLNREALLRSTTNSNLTANTPETNKKVPSTKTILPAAIAKEDKAAAAQQAKTVAKTNTTKTEQPASATIANDQRNTSKQLKNQDKQAATTPGSHVKAIAKINVENSSVSTSKLPLNKAPITRTQAPTTPNDQALAGNAGTRKQHMEDKAATIPLSSTNSTLQSIAGEQSPALQNNKAEVETSAKPTDAGEKANAQMNGAPVDSSISLLANIDSSVAKNAPVSDKIQTIGAPIKPRRPYFGLTVTAGLSDNKTGFPVLSEKVLNDISNSPANLTTGSTRVDNPLSNGFSSSFSFGFGGFAGIKLNKRFALTTGINYHYYATGSAVGTIVNAQRSLYDSLLKTSENLTRFYSNAPSNSFAGSTKFTNTYHLLQLPVQLEYKLNTTGKRPLVAQAGLTPGLVLSTRALYFNKSANITYINRQQFKQFQLFANGGFQVQIGNAKKMQYSIGPQLQYGLTNLTRPVVQSRQHLFYAGLQAYMTFKK